MGASVTFACAARGFPPPKITWRKQSSKLPVLRATISDNNSLVITNIHRDDADTYICQAENVFGVKNAYATLVVQGTKHTYKEPPAYSISCLLFVSLSALVCLSVVYYSTSCMILPRSLPRQLVKLINTNSRVHMHFRHHTIGLLGECSTDSLCRTWQQFDVHAYTYMHGQMLVAIILSLFVR